MEEDNRDVNQKNAGYDKQDANVRFIVGVTIIGVVLIVAAVAFLSEYFQYTKENIIYETVLSPESKRLRDLRAREDETLNSYSVIDAEKGIYRIPIDRAMELVANEAFAKRK